MVLSDRHLATGHRSRLGADCRDSPPGLERAGLERAGLTGIQVAGPRRASEEGAPATGEGRGAFLRIGLRAKTAAPPSPLAPLPPSAVAGWAVNSPVQHRCFSYHRKGTQTLPSGLAPALSSDMGPFCSSGAFSPLQH